MEDRRGRKERGKWEMRRREEERDEDRKEKEERDEYWKEKEERNGKREKKENKRCYRIFVFIIPRPPINTNIRFSFLMAMILLYPSLDLYIYFCCLVGKFSLR